MPFRDTAPASHAQEEAMCFPYAATSPGPRRALPTRPQRRDQVELLSFPEGLKYHVGGGTQKPCPAWFLSLISRMVLSMYPLISGSLIPKLRSLLFSFDAALSRLRSLDSM